MANKIYVFGIGGTGSRVLRSLAMILASGVKLPGKFDTVVPIIIDPDSANGDMNRTSDILLNYQKIKEKIGSDNDFFNAKIKTLIGLSDEKAPTVKDNFIFKIAGTQSTTFKDFIDYGSLNDTNRELVDLLYTRKELNSSMDVGFKGKPNIGSVVLNQLIKNTGYRDFADKFDDGDAIFIVSSIFGGTGAAGFPLLLKNLRSEDPQVPNSNLISNAIIGAISYLPYFKITPPEDVSQHTINHNSFASKAQAALSYYEHAIFDNRSLNRFYYTSDNSQNNYKHHDGKAKQKNNAHFLELTGALAIIDFLNDVPVMNTAEKKAVGPVCKEFGIKDDTRDIKFSSLGQNTDSILKVNLSKFALTEKFLRKGLDKNLSSKTTWVKDKGFTKEGFFNQDFYVRYLNPFLNSFNKWISEMNENDVSFNPIHDNQDSRDLLNFIKGFEVKNGFFNGNANSKKVTTELNVECKNLKSSDSKEKQFIQLFDNATEKIIKNILNK